ncbi:glycosyltransferase [Enterococcus timonensis]|uniref:glycosyltransferase n=1 Tax=Enterococcus timonensis TaxID=1852364 RepID=UPI0008D9458B|nr:glycosyltransferase [Enterococcus timonensis]
MVKKALIVASVASMIEQFNMQNIELLISLGYQVDVATNFEEPGNITEEVANQLQKSLKEEGVNCIQVDFPRGMGNISKNKVCLTILKKLAQNNYAIVHCHSPIGGVLTRLAFRNSKSKVIYTVHGFHFYKGGPLKSWLIFYPIERYLSRWTDVLLTINNEDTKIAKKFPAGEVVQIPGVGIDYQKFQTDVSEDVKQQLRLELGILETDTVLISIGELNTNKNHITGIKAMANLGSNYKYIICGQGVLEKDLKMKAHDLGLDNQIKFMGYTSEVIKYLAISDLSLFLSKREGLGLAGLEAMAAGVPLISSWVGGIKDYTDNYETGFTISNPIDKNEVKKAIVKWGNFSEKEKIQLKSSCVELAKKYDIEKVNKAMKLIYSKV